MASLPASASTGEYGQPSSAEALLVLDGTAAATASCFEIKRRGLEPLRSVQWRSGDRHGDRQGGHCQLPVWEPAWDGDAVSKPDI